MKRSYYDIYRRESSNSRVLDNRHFTHHPQPSNFPVNETEVDLNDEISRAKPIKQASQALTQDHQPAYYKSALKYKAQRSYLLLSDQDYKQISLFEDTNALRYFGLGPFFYIQFMRWMSWLFFLLSIPECIRIYICWKSDGLSDYSLSFSTYFIFASLGNFKKNVISEQDPYLMALIPFSILALFALTSLIWKCFFSSQLSDQQENSQDIKPQKFCVEVSSDDKQLSPSELKNIMTYFGPVHEVSQVRRFNDKLGYFEELEALQESIKEEELEIKLEGGTKGRLKELEKDLHTYEKGLKGLKIRPEVLSAYVHFEYEKSKHDCLQFFNNHYLFESWSHGCARNCCCCCIDKPSRQFLLRGVYPIYIKNQEVPAPEDINWQSFEASACSLLLRYIFAFFMVTIFLLLSCTIIGLCTIYISTHSSNCDSVSVPTTLTQAQASTSESEIKCYCNANIISSLTDPSIKSFCNDYLSAIYLEQAVQMAIILVAAITNVIFGFIIDKTVNCTRPSSHSGALKIKTVIYTLFLIFNTIFLPVLLYSDIFGFKASSYFSFLKIISTDITNFLQVDSIQFYLDYNAIWYRNVSPIFTNYLVFDILIVWLMFLVSKCRASTQSLKDEQGKILQKHMNQKITNFQISVYKEYSYFMMIIFMAVLMGTGLPVLMPLAFLNLTSRYITNRSLLQHNSTRIEGLGVNFNYVPHTVTTVLLIMAGINGGWMLTANASIYPSALPFRITISNLNEYSLLDRQFYLPFYIILSLLAVCQFIVTNCVLSLFSCLCSCCYEKKQVIKTSGTRSFTDHKQRMNIATSYNIKNNDELRNAVLRMELYLEKEHQIQ